MENIYSWVNNLLTLGTKEKISLKSFSRVVKGSGV